MIGDYPAVQSYAPVGWCPDYPYTPEPPASQWSPGISGLGDTRQVVMSLPMIAGSTITTASALGAGWATAAIPIVGPAIAAVTIGLSFLWGRKGPRQKVATTEIVDKVEPLLRDNLAGYFSGPRTISSQAQALANFEAGWKYVMDSCGIPEMGTPGQWCVNDRKAGACEWKAKCSREIDDLCIDYVVDPAGVCWNWFVGYRDPIANDPHVKPDSAILAAAGGGGILETIGRAVTGGGGGTGLLLIAGLVLAGVMFMGGDKGRGRGR